MNIRVFQIDDWAFVAAENQAEAEAFLSKNYTRPDDFESQEVDEVTDREGIKKVLANHLAEGGKVPALLGINCYYA